MLVMTDCKKWDKYIKPTGYGVKIQNYKAVPAHRWVWEQANGPIPQGMVLDHTCHNEAILKGECEGGHSCEHRACVNLEHLEVVTHSQNISRGLQSMKARKFCPKGHDYSNPNNIMTRANGKRECAECNRERASLNYYKSKASA